MNPTGGTGGTYDALLSFAGGIGSADSLGTTPTPTTYRLTGLFRDRDAQVDFLSLGMWVVQS